MMMIIPAARRVEIACEFVRNGADRYHPNRLPPANETNKVRWCNQTCHPEGIYKELWVPLSCRFFLSISAVAKRRARPEWVGVVWSSSLIWHFSIWSHPEDEERRDPQRDCKSAPRLEPEIVVFGVSHCWIEGAVAVVADYS
eukprot:scaffold2632_cov158-Amphora_coffeaeformis.AAC.11